MRSTQLPVAQIAILLVLAKAGALATIRVARQTKLSLEKNIMLKPVFLRNLSCLQCSLLVTDTQLNLSVIFCNYRKSCSHTRMFACGH